MNRVKIVFLGAGLSGLSFATGYFLSHKPTDNTTLSSQYSASAAAPGTFDTCVNDVAVKLDEFAYLESGSMARSGPDQAKVVVSESTDDPNIIPVPEALDSEKLLESLEHAISAVPSLEKNLAIGQLQAAILQRLREDPDFAQQVVDYFNQSLDYDTRGALLHSLAQHSHPAVEELALSLVESDDVQDQENALQIIKNLSIDNYDAFRKVRALISPEQNDSGLLYTALDSLPNVVMATDEHHALLDQLQALSNHELPEIREKSLIEIAKRAKDIQDLNPVLQALDSGEKEAAVVALYETKVGGEALRNQLFSRMVNEAEPLEVRMVAAETLKRFVLDEHQVDAYSDFSRQNDTRSLFQVDE